MIHLKVIGCMLMCILGIGAVLMLTYHFPGVVLGFIASVVCFAALAGWYYDLYNHFKQ